jgi:hypothetical protein
MNKKKGGSVAAPLFLALLVLDVWHECHETSTLHRLGEVALPLGRQMSATATHHARVGVDVVVKTHNVFEVDMMHWCIYCFFCFH